MNAVIDKPKAKRASKVARATPAAPHGILIGGALNNLQDLLTRAWQSDDPDQNSGDSNRLLAAATSMVEDLQVDHGSPVKVERTLYDVAAQVKAALLVPDDNPTDERVALVGQIGVILSELLDDPLVLNSWSPPIRGTLASAAAIIDFSEVVPIARSLVIQALEVLWNAGDNSGLDEVWGVYHLAEWLDAQLGENELESNPDFGALGANTASTMAVMSIVNDQYGCILMRGAYTILTVAREMLGNAEAQEMAAKKTVRESQQ